ncbi:MAG: hypothetical protein JO151_09060 [Verrucomicrobia bacterium]|jgi:hypothetical protein|nr:hypothetical protein [Verrucomicrobiota bacterium]
MKRQVKELFAKAERTKEQLDEMMAEFGDSLIKLLNDEISVEEHQAMSKAVQNVQKAWKQQMDIALKALLLARKEAASKWGARPYDQYIVKGDMRGRVSSHLTVDDAIKAAKRDRERCRHPGTGMYSDVLVYQIDLDGELHPVDEREYEKQKE